ncbi:hypothetical protein [Paracoccus litorisediminis]|uniref:Uncharacterized protein n=1 Tax=Paracoccus litorisediminis TaxID=2006130 RepID=A0A844HRV4_9RHOB|nr:hypothetical protein [Paracoccus litorisediminis]MTH61164.1 hypothetical protein [Paracoccus litorisediminis]
MNTLQYKITAKSQDFLHRLHIFTVIGDPASGIERARAEAKERGLDANLSGFRAELVVDTTRLYRTRSGKKVQIHGVTLHNSVGNEVSCPIKCSIRADKPRARSRYAILTIDGRRGIFGKPEHGDDIVGFWNDEVAA